PESVFDGRGEVRARSWRDDQSVLAMRYDLSVPPNVGYNTGHCVCHCLEQSQWQTFFFGAQNKEIARLQIRPDILDVSGEEDGGRQAELGRPCEQAGPQGAVAEDDAFGTDLLAGEPGQCVEQQVDALLLNETCDAQEHELPLSDPQLPPDVRGSRRIATIMC